MKKTTLAIVKKYLSMQGKRVTATGDKMNGKTLYHVTGWTGSYTLDGMLWQLNIG